MSSLKHTVYQAARALGIFRLARFITRRRVRVLAYHGFALRDEAQFRPKLFITPATFARRLDYLKRAGFRVVPLGQAVAALNSAKVAPDTVAITIDDGYAS